MHFISEELARARRAQLLQEACEQRLAAKAKARASRAVPASANWFRRPATSRG